MCMEEEEPACEEKSKIKHDIGYCSGDFQMDDEFVGGVRKVTRDSNDGVP